MLARAFLLALLVFGFCHSAEAALKYKQSLTISSWNSMEAVEERAKEFCDATIGDPDIKLINVKYNQKKKSGSIIYNAIITCYVSQVDMDFMRIDGKIFKEKHGL